MSAAKLFPPFEKVEPLTLVEAIQSLSNIHTGAGVNNPRRWERLLEKVRAGQKLAPFEKIQMVRNAGSIPLDLQNAFGILYRDSLSEDELLASSDSIAIFLSPPEAIAHLLHPEVLNKFGKRHLPAGVFKAGPALGFDAKEREWVDSEILSGSPVSAIVDSFSVPQLSNQRSIGQKRIIRSVVTSRNLHKSLNQQSRIRK